MKEFNTYIYQNTRTFSNYLTRVFSTMVVGLLTSFGVAYVVCENYYALAIKLGSIFTFLPIVLVIAELIVAVVFSSRLNKMSKTAAWVCYILYSVLTGATLSVVLLVYTLSSVLFAFIATTVLFGCMAIIGHTTSLDLTKFRSIFMVGLLSIVIVSIINALFFNSSTINYLMAVVGVLLFLVIIAYDMQRLKAYYNQEGLSEEMDDKLIIFGAFQLYLDFINLFLRILEIFGKVRDSK